MCNKQHVFTKFWHRNVRYLSMKCVTLKKVNFKSQNGSWNEECLSYFIYEVWMFLLLFTVYKTLRLHIFMIILVVWNVRYILSKFKILTHSADSNLYILSDLPVLSLNFMSVFLHHIMSLFRGHWNIFSRFSMKDTLYINLFSSSRFVSKSMWITTWCNGNFSLRKRICSYCVFILDTWASNSLLWFIRCGTVFCHLQ
jgi:hypothetical protein